MRRKALLLITILIKLLLYFIIKLYEENKCLYNVNCDDYDDRVKKRFVLEKIIAEFEIT